MEVCDLAKALAAFYEIGKERKECNALVQCFGIKYADIIEAQHISPNDIVEKSQLKGTSYATELRKGIQLAKYIRVKYDSGL